MKYRAATRGKKKKKKKKKWKDGGLRKFTEPSSVRKYYLNYDNYAEKTMETQELGG